MRLSSKRCDETIEFALPVSKRKRSDAFLNCRGACGPVVVAAITDGAMSSGCVVASSATPEGAANSSVDDSAT